MNGGIWLSGVFWWYVNDSNWLMFRVATFRESLGWGLACLFLPFAELVFLCSHWDAAKKSFFTMIVGAGIMFGGLALKKPDTSDSWEAHYGQGEYSDDEESTYEELEPLEDESEPTPKLAMKQEVESKARVSSENQGSPLLESPKEVKNLDLDEDLVLKADTGPTKAELTRSLYPLKAQYDKLDAAYSLARDNYSLKSDKKYLREALTIEEERKALMAKVRAIQARIKEL